MKQFNFLLKNIRRHVLYGGLSFIILFTSSAKAIDVYTFYVPGESNTFCASILPGSNNAEMVWNYLVNKGLTAIQAAGIMGNLQSESHFESRLVQYGGVNSRGEKSVQGQPSSLDDTMVIDGETGYGLAQWTAINRQQNLHDRAVAAGKQDSDLGVQLDYLWEELAGLLAEIQALDDVSAVTSLFMIKFERPKDQSQAAQNGRAQLSTAILAQFGSTTPTAGGASSSSTTSGCGASGSFNYGKYASLTRQELVNIILNAPNWKPQNQRPTGDIKNGIATDNLLRLLAALLENLPNELITPSVIQTGHDCRTAVSNRISNHMGGLAIDIGSAGHSQESMNNIFTWLYNNSAALTIDELIFDPVPAGATTLKHGKPLVYNAETRGQHQNHIHVSVEGPGATSCPAGT